MSPDGALGAIPGEILRLFELSRDLMATVGPDGRFRFLNPSWEATLGWSREELRSRRVLDFVHPDDRERTAAAMAGVAGDEVLDYENRYAHRDGGWRWLRWNARASEGTWYAVARDVTDYRELERRAAHDPLTGLPNRLVLTDRLEVALARLPRRSGSIAVLFVDLDRFKLANDTLGHQLGDELLVAAAGRLTSAVRAADTVTRVGGDEFVVLADDLENQGQALSLAERLIEAFEAPVVVGTERVSLSASIGVAIATSKQLRSAEEMLREADIAMYRAKALGRARYALFDSAMRADVTARREIASELRHAVDRGELWLAYQPIVSLADGTIAAVEALARWDHPLHGPVPPGDFIALAEEHGLMEEIGDWVLHTACRQAMRWRHAGAGVPVSVNIAPSQLLAEDFPDRIREALRTTGLPAGALAIEVVEATVVNRPEAIGAALGQVKDLGARIALDDFGRGATSLSYFRSLPLDEVKLDRAFVQGLSEGTVDRAIVAALVSLADEMSLALVAEGIESERELEELRRLGCRFAQGYWFARPMPPEQLDLSGYQALVRPGLGDPSVIREFMRQIGLPARIG